jgi:adenine-specific DNA-methyltransferase
MSEYVDAREVRADGADWRARRRMGIFYTPRNVADAICQWAIRSRDDVVLDPSYGGCVFFASAIERLHTFFAPDARRNLFGTDVDPRAKRFLSLLGADRAWSAAHFLDADFLTLRSSDFPVQFDSVVGNPPYVRHHKMSQKTVRAARKATAWCELPETSSYWAYFLLHATRFLKAGGRLGMVLPGAFLTADYAVKVKKHLLASFAQVRVILVRASVFGDAEERCVVLLADGYGGACRAASHLVVDTFEALTSACVTRSGLECAGDGDVPWPMSLLSEPQRLRYDQVRRLPGVCALGDVAKIRIGVVTGANDFFVLSPSRIRELGMTRMRMLPIFSSGRQLRVLSVAGADVEALAEADVPSRLFRVPEGAGGAAARRYVQSAQAVAVMRRYKCRTREPWYVIADTRVPDAFLTYVNHYAPRLVLNLASATSTNAIHRVWWAQRMSPNVRRVLALSSLTSLSGLSAELCGRSIGGGALKVEIADAAKLLVVSAGGSIDGVAEACSKADAALLASDWEGARAIADAFILRGMLGVGSAGIVELRAAHDRLMQVRLDTAGATPRRSASGSRRRRRPHRKVRTAS